MDPDFHFRFPLLLLPPGADLQAAHDAPRSFPGFLKCARESDPCCRSIRAQKPSDSSTQARTAVNPKAPGDPAAAHRNGRKSKLSDNPGDVRCAPRQSDAVW